MSVPVSSAVWETVNNYSALISLGLTVGGYAVAWKLWAKKKFDAAITNPIADVVTKVNAMKASVDSIPKLTSDVSNLTIASAKKDSTIAGMDHSMTEMTKGMKEIRSDFSELCGKLAIDKNLSIDTLLRLMRTDIQLHECMLRVHMDACGKIAYQTDAKGNTIWISRKFTEVIGVDFSQVQGRNWINTIHPSLRAIIVSDWDQAVAEQRDYEGTIRFKAIPNKVPYEGVTRAHVLKDDDGVVLGYFGYFL